MKKCEIVRKNTQFNDIIKSGTYKKNRYYYIYSMNNGLDYPKFGFAVSKKIGNAVVRNKLKRQLRMIVDNNKSYFTSGNNYIIMVRRDILEISFQEMENSLIHLMKKGNL